MIFQYLLRHAENNICFNYYLAFKIIFDWYFVSAFLFNIYDATKRTLRRKNYCHLRFSLLLIRVGYFKFSPIKWKHNGNWSICTFQMARSNWNKLQEEESFIRWNISDVSELVRYCLIIHPFTDTEPMFKAKWKITQITITVTIYKACFINNILLLVIGLGRVYSCTWGTHV